MQVVIKSSKLLIFIEKMLILIDLLISGEHETI